MRMHVSNTLRQTIVRTCVVASFSAPVFYEQSTAILHICFTYCTLLNTMVYTHRQVDTSSGKSIKLTTYKGKQLKWRCRNDSTIPKVELWFQLWHCYADFEVVYTLS